jgi:hypothetical protein
LLPAAVRVRLESGSCVRGARRHSFFLK